MIVTCPTCSCRYSVQPDALGEGKLVRCAMCSTTWQQNVVDESLEKKRRAWNLINWTLFWFVAFVFVFSLIFAKEAMIKIWPASASFYEAVGMNPLDTKKMFALRNISNFFVQKNQKLYMGLRGELANVSDKVQPIPSLVISLRDDDSVLQEKGKGLYRRVWTHDLAYKKLLPNQKVVFETELQRVPLNNLVCDIKLDLI